MKIIHIVENLDKGAVENWLVNIFIESRKLRPSWDWTFYCILGREGRLDEKVRNAGGRIVYSPVTLSEKPEFLRSLRRVLKAGNFDIIHAHHDYLSGFYLLASAGIRFKKRFLHVHNTDKALPVGNKTLHDLLLRPFKMLGTYFSNTVIGISKDTLKEFTGSNDFNSRKRKLLYYGIDMSRFDVPSDPVAIRRQLSIPDDGKILLYAGRMTDLKNPVFVVDVLHELLKRHNDVYAVFVGSGDREREVKQRSIDLNVSDHIRTLGWHDNVPMLMKASDVFVFPRKEHPKEGLGLVVVEAQAAGLPMCITNGIVEDAIVIPELAHFPLKFDAQDWAMKISRILSEPMPVSQQESLRRMKNSPFELRTATQNLLNLYER